MKTIFSRIDYFLLIPALLVVFLSFFVLSSFKPDLAQSQALFAGIGVLFFLVISFFHPYDLKTFAYYGYVFILLTLASLFFIGEVSRGSNRWIPIWGDLSIQPSEFAKPMFVLAMARLLSLHKSLSIQFFLKSIVLFGLYFGLVFVQPDLGTALVFLVIFFVMLFSVEISTKKLVGLITTAGLLVFLLGPMTWSALHDYQRERILTFLNPQRDPLGRGYNALQSIITVGSGGWTGKGLGQGTQSHNNFLPEQYTDFAFATFSEEFGFVGVVVLLALYSILLWRIFHLMDLVKERFEYGICLGVLAIIFFQIFVNVGMNSGIMPITGITLPLFSYGGSSLISFFICLGLVQAVTADKKGIS